MLKRPGGFAITDRAMEIWKLPPGAKVLEIGCGDGDTLRYLEKGYGFSMTGMDTDREKIRALREKTKADLHVGDGQLLDDFLSYTFDGVLAECVLSLMERPDEALHEARCVLKKGGYLFISDLYHRRPAPETIARIAEEAGEELRRPKQPGECTSPQGDTGRQYTDFLYQGMFLLEPLRKYLQEIGFEILYEEDRTNDLDAYAAQCLMDGDTDALCTGVNDPKDAGYFMLVAWKPDR